jgi:chromosome segregation ATPase
VAPRSRARRGQRASDALELERRARLELVAKEFGEHWALYQQSAARQKELEAELSRAQTAAADARRDLKRKSDEMEQTLERAKQAEEDFQAMQRTVSEQKEALESVRSHGASAQEAARSEKQLEAMRERQQAVAKRTVVLEGALDKLIGRHDVPAADEQPSLDEICAPLRRGPSGGLVRVRARAPLRAVAHARARRWAR